MYTSVICLLLLSIGNAFGNVGLGTFALFQQGIYCIYIFRVYKLYQTLFQVVLNKPHNFIFLNGNSHLVFEPYNR